MTVPERMCSCHTMWGAHDVFLMPARNIQVQSSTCKSGKSYHVKAIYLFSLNVKLNLARWIPTSAVYVQCLRGAQGLSGPLPLCWFDSVVGSLVEESCGLFSEVAVDHQKAGTVAEVTYSLTHRPRRMYEIVIHQVPQCTCSWVAPCCKYMYIIIAGTY